MYVETKRKLISRITYQINQGRIQISILGGGGGHFSIVYLMFRVCETSDFKRGMCPVPFPKMGH